MIYYVIVQWNSDELITMLDSRHGGYHIMSDYPNSAEAGMVSALNMITKQHRHRVMSVYKGKKDSLVAWIQDGN